MFQALSDKTKALILVLLIIAGSVIAAWILSGWQLALLIAAVQLAVVFMAKHIWMSDKSNFLLRGVVLTIVSGVVLFGNSWWQPIVSNWIHQYYPNIPLPDYSVSPITLLFLLILVTIVFRYTRPEPVIEKPEKKIADLIEGPTIKQKWESICESLSSSIRDIDRATNWSHEYYTPLDAEVEMKTSTRTNKVVKDLLEAIKESDDRLFLLVGNPGAGKSVALRKLCLDILKDSVKREYIPIYVNLKEWTDTKDWTKKPPTWEDLRNFIKQSLLQKDPYLADFFEKYYDVLDENGNLFFVLDSFDEIPQVLGTTADAKLIEDLSIVCRDFLKGSKQKRSKGILASREYRMPRQEYLEANTKLTVRPFTFEKIEQSLTQSNKVSKETVEKLLRERPELVPSLRNPFISSLLKAYLTDNNNQFPKNQADLFESYIHKSIQKAQARKGLTDIPFDDILSVTIQIAKIIFSDAGLQAPLSILRKQIAHPQFDNIVEIMRYTRIARGDSSNTSEFSFSHRRFYEYFVVQDLLKAGKADLPLENIPTDSRWRDTLVLYCEVASFEESQKIANYCWFDVIMPNNDISNRASKHCLRFLIEAFRGRQECLVDFHQDLASYVLEQIHIDNDPIDIKLAVEALGILSLENLDEGTIMALNLQDSWINDTAIRSCRHVNNISNKLKENFISIFDPINGNGIIINAFVFEPNIQMSSKELQISLSLSEAFEDIKKLIEWRNLCNHKIIKVIALLCLCSFLLAFIGEMLIYSSLYTNFVKFDNIKWDFVFSGSILFIILVLIYLFLFFYKFYYFRNTNINKYKISYLISAASMFIKKEFKKTINSLFSREELMRFFTSITLMFIFYLFRKGILDIIKATFNNLSDKEIRIVILLFIAFLLYITGFFKTNIIVFKLINSVFKSSIKFWNAYRIYIKIDKNKIQDRDYISQVFLQLYNSISSLFFDNIFLDNLFLNRFLNLLENNVKVATGKFPEGFLKVGQSIEMTRLIQLEERWREAEERAAEQQNTLKFKTYPQVEKNIKDLVCDNQLEEAIAVAFKKPNISKDDVNALVLQQSRLAALEKRKNEGRIETATYEAQLNELKKSLLNMSDELEI